MTDPHLHQRFLASRAPDRQRPADHGWLLVGLIIASSVAVAVGLAVIAFA